MKKLSGSGDIWEDIEWEVKLNPELSYENRYNQDKTETEDN